MSQYVVVVVKLDDESLYKVRLTECSEEILKEIKTFLRFYIRIKERYK